MTSNDPDFGNLCNAPEETAAFTLPPPELPDYIQQVIGYMQLLIQTLEDNAADLHSDLLTANQMLLLGEALTRATADEPTQERAA